MWADVLTATHNNRSSLDSLLDHRVQMTRIRFAQAFCVDRLGILLLWSACGRLSIREHTLRAIVISEMYLLAVALSPMPL